MMKDSVVESSKLHLEHDHAALVFTEDSVRVVTPHKDDSEIVPSQVRFAVMLAYLCSTDEVWVASTIQRFEDQTNG